MDENNNNNVKCCTDCKTTKTPLWRGGPAGPKSLCNACGIRYRKKKKIIESLNGRPEKRKDKSAHGTNITITTASAKSASGKDDDSNVCVDALSESFKMRLMVLGKEMMLRRSLSISPPPFVVKKRQRCQRRRKLKEEEQAAFSLMALSCGFVFA